MSAYDLIVRGGFVVDGTGLPRRRVDVGVRDGKIATLAHLEDADATEVIDADGLIVAPGSSTPTPTTTPRSPSIRTRRCRAFTVSPRSSRATADSPSRHASRLIAFLSGIFARVENMDPIALSAITWDEFETFPEFLATREGRLGVNFACYVGHSNLRRWVMGPDASFAHRDRFRDRRDA